MHCGSPALPPSAPEAADSAWQWVTDNPPLMPVGARTSEGGFVGPEGGLGTGGMLLTPSFGNWTPQLDDVAASYPLWDPLAYVEKDQSLQTVSHVEQPNEEESLLFPSPVPNPFSLDSSALEKPFFDATSTPVTTESTPLVSCSNFANLQDPPKQLRKGKETSTALLDKRQRNNIAARKHRQKKTDRIHELEKMLREVLEEKDDLKLCLARREAEVNALRLMLNMKNKSEKLP
ncbi:hypothetical protein KAF25_001519 [Fusarium avenaceum]|uniref:BZIP domain-containing protein n=1 Tax=Fusarium avenaceum TaxID=40199 RepID=A0A9P7KV38_9HYPO|nr:hypothetical protein KAF25_001519 [Fusarium avenaceum]